MKVEFICSDEFSEVLQDDNVFIAARQAFLQVVSHAQRESIDRACMIRPLPAGCGPDECLTDGLDTIPRRSTVQAITDEDKRIDAAVANGTDRAAGPRENYERTNQTYR